ncbi:hypothetical protein [Spirosoma montaniterrae]|uniref:DUF3108 domain-containing protein n=1 Tax=Spirosoma montaniterrae TaxID=1178516 RepID=A0A1P9WXA3_9BACT|nr:hypothetical protein [Spirosoma montaniterrae]AQG79973.1 hypothetical protein AWR27_11940 [Spirosoma montaniterrae]
MKVLIFSLLLVLGTLTTGWAQDCLGFSMKTGMSYQMSTYNAKDKLTGVMSYRVNDVRKEGGATLVDMTVQVQDEKGKTQPPYTIRYTCKGDELLADLSGALQGMQTAMKDAQLKMKSNSIVYPASYSVGQKLADGQIEADFLTNGTTMMEMNMTMVNRQVEGKESITTPAGTFDTYKVASDMNFTNRTMGIPIRGNMRVVSYRAPNQLLDIKSETFNKNGKLMGYTLLTKVN